MAHLELAGLTKRYGSTVAVDGLDLRVEDREFVTLLGPSGSGKTTVLRMIAGYVAPTAGTIRIASRAVHDLPPERRDIGMVFQSYALFPHMTVRDNVAFGLRRRRVARDRETSRVAHALDVVRLSGLDHRYPSQLSGGQQQRVALARALVIEPTVLLLDEPMSNLDARLRSQVRLEIRQLQRELGITTILVTHDQDEALTMSDRVAVIDTGRLQQLASPGDLYERPANRFVAEFVGHMNLLRAVRQDARPDTTTYRLDSGVLVTVPSAANDGSGLPSDGLLAVRPETIRIGSPDASAPVNRLAGTVAERAFLGEIVELRVDVGLDLPLRVRGVDLRAPGTSPGEPVELWWEASRTTIVPAGDDPRAC